MSEGVVHHLEPVQIEVEQRQLVTLAPGEADRLVQAVVEKQAVRQFGDVVVMRQALHALLGILSLRDITDDAGKTPCAAQAHLGHVDLDREFGSAPAPCRDLSWPPDRPGFACSKVARDVAIVLARVRLRHQDADVLSQDVPGLVAEHALGGAVERLDRAALIDGDDAFGGDIQHRLGVRGLALQRDSERPHEQAPDEYRGNGRQHGRVDGRFQPIRGVSCVQVIQRKHDRRLDAENQHEKRDEKPDRRKMFGHGRFDCRLSRRFDDRLSLGDYSNEVSPAASPM